MKNSFDWTGPCVAALDTNLAAEYGKDLFENRIEKKIKFKE
jgi:hypothetical protein